MWKNIKMYLDGLSRTILNYFMFIYLGLGGGLLIGIVVIIAMRESTTELTLEDFRALVTLYIPPIGILLASQIAGFAVVRTINNTNDIEQRKKKEEAEKAKKVLEAYFRHFQSLGIGQINLLNEFIKYVNSIPIGTRLSDSNIDKVFYDDNTNLRVFMNPIESMLSPDLHKYMDAEIIDYILNLKLQVVKMMHTMKIVQSTLIPMNSKKEFVLTIAEMKAETEKILNDSKTIMHKIGSCKY